MKFWNLLTLIVLSVGINSFGCKDKASVESPEKTSKSEKIEKAPNEEKNEKPTLKNEMEEGHDHSKHMKKGMKMPKRYQSVAMSKAEILQKGEAKMYCNECGMTLPAFYKTNHAAKVDGKVKQFCSIYCLVEVMKTGTKVSGVKVVDNTTLKFVDAKKATYVVGSSKPPTMAANISKYAFGKKSEALAFAKEFDGKVMTYDQTLAVAQQDFESDTKQKKMRQAKAAIKGKMIFEKKCKNFENKFTSAAQAKAYIQKEKVCGDIKGMQLQAVSLYLLSK